MEPEPISEKDTRALDWLFNRYTVRSILGQGASSTVYLADDPVLGLQVVIKLLSAAEADSEQATARFRQEIESTTRLQHPNLVRTLDCGETRDHRPYLVTEYTPGRSLSAVLRESGRLETGDAVDVAVAIADALAYVHANHLIHRDLKPSNVLIPGWPDSPNYSGAKLLDFGVAGRLEQSGRTQAGMIYGSLRYMAPEQIRGEAQSGATDVYGFGLLLFEMLAGAAPAGRDQDLTTLLLAINKGLSDKDLQSVPASLADLIRRCTLSSPSERPGMAAVLAELKDSFHRRREIDLTGLTPLSFKPPAPPPTATAPEPPSAAKFVTASILMQSTLALDVDRSPATAPGGQRSPRPEGVGSISGRRGWLLWIVLASVVAVVAIAAILLFRPVASGPQPRPNESTAAPEKAAPSENSLAGPGESSVRAVRFGAGLLLMAASLGMAFGLRKWLGGRTEVKEQAYQLVFGARARTDLTATIAVQLQDLVANLRQLDQRILAGTVALMLDEYGKATDTKDRQAALMNVVALSEKLSVRLSPWYERHKEVIASAVAVMGGISGLMTAINSVLQHKH